MTEKFELDSNLREFATDRQWELLSVWAEHGSAQRAAEALGVTKNLPIQAKSRVLRRAARRGYTPQTPEFHLGVQVPAGFVLKGQSVLVDSHGNLRERWDKTRQEGLDPDEARKLPDPKKTVKLSTMTDAEGRVIQQWVSERPEDVARERAWREFAKELARDLPRVEPTSRTPGRYLNELLLAGYPVGDHHLGMLAWPEETEDAYDLEIGERLLRGAFDYLTHAAGGAGHGLVAFLGDFMHYDSFETVTPTARNMLDSDTRFPKPVRAAVRTMRYAVDAALRAHQEVRVIVEAGNHDLASSVFLATCLEVAYEREPRVSVDTSPRHFHYHRHGRVLVGTHHGHGTKMQNLPLIMATDRAEDWGATDYRYWWTGHTHRQVAHDAPGCSVESFRVLPPGDAHERQKGRRKHRSMKAIVLHADHGEVARHTVNPQMLEES